MMRTFLVPTLAALALALPPSPDAEACGSYRTEPRVLLLTTHVLHEADTGTPTRTRTFAIDGGAAPEDARWRVLPERRYDRTAVAEGVALPGPVTLTLVGPSGARVVEARTHVYVKQRAGLRGTAGAYEIAAPRGAYQIAIEGRHARARWIPLGTERRSRAAVAWVTALGVTPLDADAVSVRAIGETELELVSVVARGAAKPIVFLRAGDRNLGRYDGTPLGAVVNDGVRQLVMARGAATQTVYLGAVANAEA